MRQPTLYGDARYFAVAALLLLPSLALGILISHSSPQNLTWAAQLSEQFRAFVFYPRWMPLSFDGLGSPAFYFYPPLPFWVDALVLGASGVAMRSWLQQETGNLRAAFWGGLVTSSAWRCPRRRWAGSSRDCRCRSCWHGGRCAGAL